MDEQCPMLPTWKEKGGATRHSKVKEKTLKEPREYWEDWENCSEKVVAMRLALRRGPVFKSSRAVSTSSDTL